MSEYANDDAEYCLLIGKMVYDEVEWSWEHIPNLFDENYFWIDAMAQRFYECRLEAYGCLDADL